MQVVILAGGFGTRLSEETKKIPKPMVRIAGIPILIHIICCYLKYDFCDFIICSGYKSKIIENYFKKKIRISKKYKSKNNIIIKNLLKKIKSIKIINTGLKTQTGARLKKISKYLNKIDNNFFFTYGDGLCDLDLKKLKKFHLKYNKLATITAVRPKPRYGKLKIRGNKVLEFSEKDPLKESWINGGFAIFNKYFFKYLSNKNSLVLEKEPLTKLAKDKNLIAFKHKGFWQPMDTLRDKNTLENLLLKSKAPWL